MTIELSLRRRASRSRLVATLWILFSAAICIGTYISLPHIAAKTAATIAGMGGDHGNLETVAHHGDDTARGQILMVTVLILSFSLVLFACYQMGRAAFVEVKMAARLAGLADALCICGSDMAVLSKATDIFVPSSEFLALTTESPKDRLKAVTELVNQFRGTASSGAEGHEN